MKQYVIARPQLIAFNYKTGRTINQNFNGEFIWGFDHFAPIDKAFAVFLLKLQSCNMLPVIAKQYLNYVSSTNGLSFTTHHNLNNNDQ
jgi:hypothetical protein